MERQQKKKKTKKKLVLERFHWHGKTVCRETNSVAVDAVKTEAFRSILDEIWEHARQRSEKRTSENTNTEAFSTLQTIHTHMNANTSIQSTRTLAHPLIIIPVFRIDLVTKFTWCYAVRIACICISLSVSCMCMCSCVYIVLQTRKALQLITWTEILLLNWNKTKKIHYHFNNLSLRVCVFIKWNKQK